MGLGDHQLSTPDIDLELVEAIEQEISDELFGVEQIEEDYDDDEALPITEEARIELHIGHDIIVDGKVWKPYIKAGDKALPGENDLMLTHRVQQITVNTWLNHAATIRMLAKIESDNNKPSR